MDKRAKTIDDLNRGEAAQPVDVLRLAMHYLLRGGWTPNPVPSRAGVIHCPVGHVDAPVSINSAIARARVELRASWMVGLEATRELCVAVGLPREQTPALPLWERAPERSETETRDAFRRAILNLTNEPQKGVFVDISV